MFNAAVPRASNGSATDAIADMCGIRRVDPADDLQLHVHQRAPIARCSLCLRHRAHDAVIHITDQRAFGDRGIRRPVAWHEDHDAVAIPTVVIDLLHGATPGEDGAARSSRRR